MCSDQDKSIHYLQPQELGAAEPLHCGIVEEEECMTVQLLLKLVYTSLTTVQEGLHASFLCDPKDTLEKGTFLFENYLRNCKNLLLMFGQNVHCHVC